MKTNPFFLPLLLLIIFISACTNENPSKEKVLAHINNYKITIDEYNEKLAKELEYDNSYKATSQAKEDFLNELIKKELLIQEAKRLGLDSKQKFIATIERYWESTLIRDLMEMKGSEIAKQVNVTEQEVDTYIASLDSKADILAASIPDESKKALIAEYLAAKKREQLQKWVNELRTNAKVTINKDLLNDN